MSRVFQDSSMISMYNRWKNMRGNRCAEWDVFDVFVSDMGAEGPDKVLIRSDKALPFSLDNCEWIDKEDSYRGENNPNYKGAIVVSICKNCGTEIKHHTSSTRIYCSKECRNAHNKKARVCKFCGRSFIPDESADIFFCSIECRDLLKIQKEENKTEKTHKRKYGTRITRFCKICGKRMTLRPSQASTKFCSRACYGKAIGLRQQGDKHHMWKGGTAKARDAVRASPLYKAWRTSVFERDDYTCQSCFTKGGKLRAHHMVPYKDAPRLRLKKSNGITLCDECHRQWHVFDNKGIFEGLEKNLQAKAIDMFRAAGFFVFNVHGHALQARGIPDIIMCYCGYFVAVEFKVHPNFLDPIQKMQINLIKNSGGIAYMVRSEDDVERIIDEMRVVALGVG